MELLFLIEPQPSRLAIALLHEVPLEKPIFVNESSEPYRAPNGLWFWARKSKQETVQ